MISETRAFDNQKLWRGDYSAKDVARSISNVGDALSEEEDADASVAGSSQEPEPERAQKYDHTTAKSTATPPLRRKKGAADEVPEKQAAVTAVESSLDAGLEGLDAVRPLTEANSSSVAKPHCDKAPVMF